MMVDASAGGLRLPPNGRNAVKVSDLDSPVTHRREEHMARKVLAAGMVFVGLLLISPVAAQEPQETLPQEKLYITAFAVNMSNIATGANAVVDIRINSWSTAAERQHLITTMLEKGSNALLRELQKSPEHGRWNIPGLQGPDPHQLRLGHDIRYARQQPLPDGGRRIIIATDRYIGFGEARNQPRSIDYPFTLMEIHVDKNGEGEGKMAVATKISFDKKKNQMELENYSSEPVRLQNLKVKVKSS
jgi:hypothetical protein